MSPLTIFLSKLIGLFALLVGLSMALQRQSVVATAAMLVRDRPLLLLLGMIALIGGLAIVLSHNVWSGGPTRVLVTLFGWIFLIRGLALLALSPQAVVKIFEFFRFDEMYYVYVAITLALGGYLTYAGFTASHSSNAGSGR